MSLAKHAQNLCRLLRRILTVARRYLIADYERSSFSINQCRFIENATPDIRPILPSNTTKATNGTNPTDSNHKHGADGLIPGVIAAIVVGSTVFLVVLIIASLLVWRRKLKSKTPGPSQPDVISVLAETVDSKTQRELHTDPIIPPELDGVLLGPPEMEHGVAAVEMSAMQGERHELYGCLCLTLAFFASPSSHATARSGSLEGSMRSN